MSYIYIYIYTYHYLIDILAHFSTDFIFIYIYIIFFFWWSSWSPKYCKVGGISENFVHPPQIWILCMWETRLYIIIFFPLLSATQPCPFLFAVLYYQLSISTFALWVKCHIVSFCLAMGFCFLYLSLSHSVHLSVCLYVLPSLYLSVYLSCVFVCL